MTDYTNASQQRVLTTLKSLIGHEFDGLTITQIALITESSTVQVTRDLANLELQGFAERIGGERWRVGKTLLDMFNVYSLSLQANIEKTISESLRVIIRS